MPTRIDKKQTRTHKKLHTSRNTKKEELEQRRQRIQRMQAQEISWTERRLCAKHQTPKKKQQRLPQKIVQENETKTCSVDERNPPKKKEIMNL